MNDNFTLCNLSQIKPLQDTKIIQSGHLNPRKKFPVIEKSSSARYLSLLKYSEPDNKYIKLKCLKFHFKLESLKT